MFALHGSVGRHGSNRPEDIALVQKLLKEKGHDPGKVDGICGERTIAALQAFQSGFLHQPDGLVTPGGRTWQQLLARDTLPAKTAMLEEWSGDSARWPRAKKLESMNPQLRPRIVAVLGALERRGFRPKIFYGWRSVAVQLELYERGNSKVKFSFHNAQKPDGTPCAYAADIVDERYGWSVEAEKSGFWKALGEEAKHQGLYWGGDWSSFRDWAHVQLVPNSQLGAVKKVSGL